MVNMQSGPKQFSILVDEKNKLKLKMLLFSFEVEKQVKRKRLGI